jgi:hypothetical protein
MTSLCCGAGTSDAALAENLIPDGLYRSKVIAAGRAGVAVVVDEAFEGAGVVPSSSTFFRPCL